MIIMTDGKKSITINKDEAGILLGALSVAHQIMVQEEVDEAVVDISKIHCKILELSLSSTLSPIEASSLHLTTSFAEKEVTNERN